MSVEARIPTVGVEKHEQAQDYLTSAPRAPQPRRLPGALVFLIAVALIGAMGMLYLLQTNHVANLGYEMSQLQAEREAALVEQQKLSAQIAEKQALKAIESTARIELGMRPIGAHVFLDVELPPTMSASATATPAEGNGSTLERFWNRLTGSSSDTQASPPRD